MEFLNIFLKKWSYTSCTIFYINSLIQIEWCLWYIPNSPQSPLSLALMIFFNIMTLFPILNPKDHQKSLFLYPVCLPSFRQKGLVIWGIMGHLVIWCSQGILANLSHLGLYSSSWNAAKTHFIIIIGIQLKNKQKTSLAIIHLTYGNLTHAILWTAHEHLFYQMFKGYFKPGFISMDFSRWKTTFDLTSQIIIYHHNCPSQVIKLKKKSCWTQLIHYFFTNGENDGGKVVL